MNKEEVLKLAKLARIDISEAEAESLSEEFGSILSYVGEIKNANLAHVEAKKEDFVLRNVMREDTDPHEPGIHTEALLNEAPKRKGDYVEVKKIL
jgi:aspartyl-tRNA(Asn)/glutamyl-tRNA(Gln) amidotransferase subunit C